MSGEHLWPDWMGEFIPKGPNDSHLETWDTFDFMTPKGPTEVKTARGHATTRKIRRVCKKCNNEWMNHIDDNVKPYVLPMMYGQNVSLNTDAQKAVVDFIALKCMVFENNRREDAATTLEQRQAFMNDRVIPAYTQIHLFCCGETPWDWQFHRHSANAIKSPPPDPLHPRMKNIQTFAIGIGGLLVYVLQAFAADVEFRFERIAARQLWPLVDEVLTWPPVLRATAAEAERIAENMSEFIRENFGRTPPVRRLFSRP
jgi:hypothetical protein